MNMLSKEDEYYTEPSTSLSQPIPGNIPTNITLSSKVENRITQLSPIQSGSANADSNDYEEMQRAPPTPRTTRRFVMFSHINMNYHLMFFFSLV